MPQLAKSPAPQDGEPRQTADSGDISSVERTRDLWNDDGDDFFGSTLGTQNAIVDDDQSVSGETKNSAKAPEKPPAKRGRKPGSGKGLSHKRKGGPVTGDTLPEDL